MKTSHGIKLYRDQALWRDLSFLAIGTAFLLVKTFGYAITDALLLTPLVVTGVFGALWLAAHTLLLILNLLDRLTGSLGTAKRLPPR